MARKPITENGIVYSTDKSYTYNGESKNSAQLLPAEQKLKVRMDTRNRGGKAVTIIEGYQGAGLEETGKNLKVSCGTGGSVKDGIIIIQGDHRDKVIEWLSKNGYRNVKKL